MHHANYFYGHAHVLARYCGLDDARHPPRLHGYLQHGWNVGDGLAPGTPFAFGSKLFVWSDQTRRRAWSQGRRDAIVTGSPFAYLVSMQPSREDSTRAGAIFYPFHGWEGQRVIGDHERLAAQVRDTETGPLTACLYWHDLRNPGIRRAYRRAGFRVISHGLRGYWWREQNPRFLDDQLSELRAHRRVVSNRLSSAIWYGLLAGCEAAVYGDPMLLERADETFGGDRRLRSQWPELFGPVTDADTTWALARAELGADELSSPAELRAHLGWVA